jgi:Skp family chaperone for outer membrane proteins
MKAEDMTVKTSFSISSSKLILLAATLVVVCTMTFIARTDAAPAPSQAPVIASVDMSKIIAGYSKKASADAAFQAVAQQYQDIYKTQTANAMLDADDQNKLGQLLLLGDSATPDQKQQIADLETKAGTASDNLAALQQNKALTDDQKMQLQQLTQQQQDGQGALKDIGDQYQQTLDQRNQSMSANIAADIRVAVAAVAKNQGVTVVFDNSVAIYSSIDLTDAVIAKLAATK